MFTVNAYGATSARTMSSSRSGTAASATPTSATPAANGAPSPTRAIHGRVSLSPEAGIARAETIIIAWQNVWAIPFPT